MNSILFFKRKHTGTHTEALKHTHTRKCVQMNPRVHKPMTSAVKFSRWEHCLESSSCPSRCPVHAVLGVPVMEGTFVLKVCRAHTISKIRVRKVPQDRT